MKRNIIYSIVFVFCSSFVFYQSSIQASDVARSGSTANPNTGSSLPKCVDDEAEIDSIVETMKANSKTAHKYNGYKKALESDSDTELLARLAYAETLAANCNEHNEKIAPKIVEAIANRVAFRKGDVKSVIFQRDQFASSLHRYGASKHKEFLCPKDQKLWQIARIHAAKILSGQAVTNSLPKDSVNYYLFNHANFKVPEWASGEGPRAYKQAHFDGDKELHNCIRFYHVPKWK